MREIWAPEAAVVAFLALPFLRPFVKALRPLDGLGWLPPIALLLMIGIFPAYGFRPECLPLLVVAAFISTVHFFFCREDAHRRRSSLLAALSLSLLAAAAVPAFAFAPRVYTGWKEKPGLARTLKAGASGRDYSLRIYETAPEGAAALAERPLVFLVPPEIGSAASVDLVCRELLENGFTVVTYSREGRDSLLAAMGRWRVCQKAAGLHKANEKGKALEAGRRLDIEYLLPLLPSLLGGAGRGDLPPLLLVGYGAGGSALAYMAGENRLGFLYGNTLGAVSVEGRLWSSYVAEGRAAPEIPVGAGRVRHQWFALTSRLRDMGPRKVAREGPLPAAGLPVLYLISGRALDADTGHQPYQAVFDVVRQGSGPAALAAIESAGPLDYQDYPLTRPVYSFLLPGQKDAKRSRSPVGDTAAIIGNFAVFLLEQAGGAGEAGIPGRQPIDGSLYFEGKGLGGFMPQREKGGRGEEANVSRETFMGTGD